jgi:excisionase family DNA binding protein
MTVAEVAAEVMEHYVTPSWVAKFYGVPKLDVYRAIKAGKLKAYRVRGGSLVLDARLLPSKFPR